MRRKIKQKIGFLHPERGVNEPVRRTRQATSAEHPGAGDGVQGALTDAEGPGIVRFRVPDVREKPETHVNGGKSFRMVRVRHFRRQLRLRDAGKGISNAKMFRKVKDASYPALKHFQRLKIRRIQLQNISKG